MFAESCLSPFALSFCSFLVLLVPPHSSSCAQIPLYQDIQLRDRETRMF